jgi:hypothetical protein
VEYRTTKEVLSLALSLLLFHPFFFSLPFFKREEDDRKVMAGYARGREGAQGKLIVLRALQC